ncbi:S-layer homology domain-containing protein [Paenibacillus sp. GXUN7292]|uniref:S-layer homology domain-containing protein n=1 Tax=Paenibacillus sp. GXUN7292 TaxID=3422499 RepID=UPI003D7E74FB
MKKQLSIVLTVMLFCTVLINPFVNASEFKANAAEPLEEVKISDFETDEEVWQFGLGDGVGAQGSFVRDDSEFFEEDYSGKLSGNFGAGGSFVVLSRGFIPIDMKSLSFQIKTSDINKITIRLKDAAGQVHQQTINLQATEDWQKVEVSEFNRGLGYVSFGTGTPGVWNGPADRIEFLLEKSRLTGGKTSGTVWIDDITAMATPQQELWKAEVGSFDHSIDLWELGFGMEFPGANGQFIRDASEVKSGTYSGKIAADFKNGGKYISLGRELPSVTLKKLEFWVKTSDMNWISLRIKDGTGQVHQQKIPLIPNGEWSKIELLKFNGGKDYFSFGGAQDKIWHDPVQRIEFLVEQSSFVNGKQSGDIWIDQVEMTAEYPVLEIQQTQLGNIFLENEPVALQLATQATSVQWSVYDHLEKKVLEGREVVSNQLLELTIPLQSKGYYTVVIRAEKDGQVIAEKEVSLARLSAEDPTLTDDSPFGISTHLAWVKEGWSTELSKLIKRAGAKSFRDEITWESLEYEKGKYRKPANRDAFMKRTLEDELNPFIILNYTNPFYDQNSTPYTDEGREGFANYGVALLDLYEGQINSIEVYNEFNGSFGSRGNGIAGSRPDSYVKMLKKTYETIKAKYPEVTVVGMATAGTPLDWIEEVFKLGGLEYMDVVSIHPYQSQRPPDGMVQAVRSTQELMRKYNNGQEKPIWYTEIGWPTKASIGIPENNQANFVVRTYVQALAEGVEKVFWYDLMNDGMQEDYYEHHLGMLRNRADEFGAFTPKPSYASYAAMTRELINAAFDRQEYEGTDIFSYKFDKNGEELRVVWSNEPLQAGIETDTPIQITDMMGNTETYSPILGKVYLTLSGEPHYVKGAVKSIAKSSLFSILGESVVAGEEVALSLKMNNEGASPIKVSFDFEGNIYPIEANGGEQAVQPLQPIIIPSSGSKTMTGFLEADGKRAGKLQHVVQSIQPYEVKVYPILDASDANQQSIALQIKNFSKQQELVLAKADWRIGNQQGVYTEQTVIAPDSTSIVQIALDAQDLEKSYPVSVQVQFEHAAPFSYTGKFDFNPVYERTLKIDGELDKAITAAVPNIHLSQGTVQMTGYTGKADLDGQFWLSYDRDYFYLSAKITDDVHAYQAEGADIWKNDSIQFALAKGMPGSSNEWYEYGISDTVKGAQIYRWIAPLGKERGLVSNGQVSIKSDEANKQTIYELALPWSELAPIKYNQPEGFHFSLLVNDNDGNGRKGWIEWASGIGLEKKPSLYRSMQWMFTPEPWVTPKAKPGTFTVAADTALRQALQAEFDENAVLRYEIVDQGTKGIAVISNSETGEFTYTPNAGAFGEDTFTFRVHDGFEYSNTAAVTVTIQKKSGPPPVYPGSNEPGGGQEGSGNGEGNGDGDGDGDGNGTDPEPQQLHLKDIKEHWARAAIEKAVQLQIVRGYDDQTFHPDKAVSRQELIVMLDRALKPAGDGEAASFTDQAKIGAWAKDSIARAVQAGWLTGYTDGSFRPGNGISRAEMSVVLAKAAKLIVEDHADTSFADDASIPVWAKGSIAAAVEEGLLQGRGNNRFAASGTVTRAEAAIIAVRLLERMAVAAQ